MPVTYLTTILALGWLKTPVLILFFVSAILLIFLVLIQKSKEGGLTGVFGMGGDSSLLGTRAATFLGKVTVVLGVVFLGMALVYVMLDYWTRIS